MKSIDTRVSSAATDKLDKINFYKGPFNYNIESGHYLYKTTGCPKRPSFRK